MPGAEQADQHDQDRGGGGRRRPRRSAPSRRPRRRRGAWRAGAGRRAWRATAPAAAATAATSRVSARTSRRACRGVAPMVRSRPISTSRWVTVMPTVETTAKSTIRAPQPPTTAPMMKRVSWSVAETGPVAVCGQGRERAHQRGAEQHGHERRERGRGAVPQRGEGQAGHDATLRDQLVEVGHLSGDRVGGGAVHPARDPSVDEEDHGVGVRRRDRVVGDHDDRLTAASSTQARSRASTSCAVAESRAPVGSSARTTAGSVTSARAIATRCCWPPESSEGSRPPRSPRPTRSSSARTRYRSTRCPASRMRQPDVLLGGEVGHQVEALEDEADPLAAEPGAVLLAPVGDVLAGDDDAALGGPLETGGAGEERRLAGPGGPHHRGEGAGREGEVDAGEGGDGAGPFAVRAGEVVDLECGRAWCWVFMSLDARNDRAARARWAWTASRGGVLPTPSPIRLRGGRLSPLAAADESASESSGASPSGCGCRRRCRSSTQRPRTPRARPADLGAVELGAGDVDRLQRRGRDRQHALAAERLGRGLVLGDQAERGQHRRQQHGGQRAVAGRRGVELVGAEQQRRRGRELRSEDRAERDGPAAALEDGDGLRRGQPPRPGARHLLERRRDRLDGAEVGAGADEDRHARVPEPAHGLGEVRRRTAAGRTRWVTSLAPIRITATSGSIGSARSSWPPEVGGAGADLRERAQVDPPVGALRHPAGEQRAGSLLDPVDAVARPRSSRRAARS